MLFIGGAGTTAAGLRYGLPTFVCPFFGDQFMWGAMVHRAGVGPEPCRVDKLTVEILAKKFEELKDVKVRERAVELSTSMKHENGVLGGLQHFLDCLPRDNMLCDVSLLLGETSLARYRILNSDVKISLEVATTLRDQPLRKPRSGTDFLVNILISVNVVLNWLNPSRSTRQTKHAVLTYALGRVRSFSQGVAAGWFGLLRELFRGLFDTYLTPDKFARTHGALGCLFGLLIAPMCIVYDVFRGCVIFMDRVMVGISNGCFKADKLFLIDPMVRATVYQTEHDLNELLNYDTPSESRRNQLKYAVRIANNASQLFKLCNPKFPEGHWHWLEVELKLLTVTVIHQGKDRLSLMDEELEVLVDCLRQCTLRRVSFSRFCLFLGEAVKDRLGKLHRRHHKIRPDFNPAASRVIVPVGDMDDDEDSLLKPLTGKKMPYMRVRANTT